KPRCCRRRTARTWPHDSWAAARGLRLRQEPSTQRACNLQRSGRTSCGPPCRTRLFTLTEVAFPVPCRNSQALPDKSGDYHAQGRQAGCPRTRGGQFRTRMHSPRAKGKSPGVSRGLRTSLGNAAASELVLHRNAEQIAGVVEAADQVVAGGAHVVDVAIVDEQMRVADVERQVLGGRVACADRDPFARTIRNARITREVLGRGLVEGQAAAQRPLVAQLVIHADRAEPG